MDLFWKTIAIAFVAVILALALERQGKDFSLLLTLAASGMIAMVAAKYLEPVLKFLGQLEELGDINNGLLLTLMKILGVGLTGEIASAVCNDGGNSSLGKGIRMLSNAAVFYLSVPVFSSVIDLIRLLVWNS